MTKVSDMTQGSIAKSLWLFAVPLMLGNVMQQFYNLADTWVVGRFIGSAALGAVGSSYTLMTFLTSVIIGLCLGCSAFTAMAFGRRDMAAVRSGLFMSGLLTAELTLVIMVLFYSFLWPIIRLLQVPADNADLMHTYLFYVFFGFFFTYIYNFCVNILRGIGNAVVPLVFLGISVVLNVGLDLLFVAGFRWGIRGAAAATVLAQAAAGVGIMVYIIAAVPELRLHREDRVWHREHFRQILALSGYTCLQQSVMNFGILLVQGIVNSFGVTVMAAFAVAVKIDTLAYMPVQDFGNAFAVFTAQNYGAKAVERIRRGIRTALVSVTAFCLPVSAAVCFLAPQLMTLFVGSDDPAGAVTAVGTGYLRIEGACYLGIGILFLLYGYFRSVNRPLVSVVLTVISLGVRVFLAAMLSQVPSVGVIGIWTAIPVGWFLADLTGGVLLWRDMNRSRDTIRP